MKIPVPISIATPSNAGIMGRLGSGILVLFLATLLGLVAGTGQTYISIALIVLVGIGILSLHPWFFTWSLLFISLTVLGAIRLYVPEWQILRWVYPFAAGGIPIVMFMLQAFQKRQLQPTKLPTLFWWVVAFIGVSVISCFLNWRGLKSLLLALKEYFQIWGFLLVFAFIRFNGHFIRGFVSLILVIAFLQLPFVLHQYFFVVPNRPNLPGLQPDDVIAGTFGADFWGGGNNALLAAYLVMSIGLVISLWRTRSLSGWRALVGSILLVFPVFLNETKVSFFYIWVMFLVLFWEDIVRKPSRFILGHIALVIFLGFFVSMYAYLAAAGGHRVEGAGDYLQFIAERNLGPAANTFELNRFTALPFWFYAHFPGDLAHAIVGHGLGQTQEGGFLKGDVYNTLAALKYRGRHIGVSALSALLWDVGVFGLAVLTMLFLSAFRLAGRLAVHCTPQPLAAALFKSMQAGVAILFLTIPHKNLFVFELTEQALFVLVVGFLIYSARHLNIPSSATGQTRNG